MSRSHRSLVVALLAMVLVIATGACSCQNLVADLVGSPAPVAVSTPTAVEIPPTPGPTTPPEALVLPEGSGQPFTLELSEADINAQITDETFSQEGLEIQDVRVALAQDQVLVQMYANYAKAELAGDVTLRGKPVVVDGQVYVQIEEVLLGSTFTGFTRVLAQGIIQEALKQYDEGRGIPVPTEDMVVESVQVLPGKMVITGKTK